MVTAATAASKRPTSGWSLPSGARAVRGGTKASNGLREPAAYGAYRDAWRAGGVTSAVLSIGEARSDRRAVAGTARTLALGLSVVLVPVTLALTFTLPVAQAARTPALAFAAFVPLNLVQRVHLAISRQTSGCVRSTRLGLRPLSSMSWRLPCFPRSVQPMSMASSGLYSSRTPWGLRCPPHSFLAARCSAGMPSSRGSSSRMGYVRIWAACHRSTVCA